MLQLYLLSIVANILAGLTLSSDYLGEKISILSSFKMLRENRVAEITIGAAALIIGVFKFIITSPGEGVPVVGDLLPALTGVALGLIMLGEAFHQKVESRSESIRKVSRTVLSYRVPVGIGGVVIAVLHFFIPGVLFL